MPKPTTVGSFPSCRRLGFKLRPPRMKTLLTLFLLVVSAFASPPAPVTSKPSVGVPTDAKFSTTSEIPKERLTRVVHILQVAEEYAKSGTRPNGEEYWKKAQSLPVSELRSELARLLPLFTASFVIKERRPEVFGLYSRAIQRLTLDREGEHVQLAAWASSHPGDWSSEMRKLEHQGQNITK